MTEPKPTIYAICLPGKPPRYDSEAAILKPIDATTTGKMAALNPFLGELTAIDWIIAETKEEWVGNAQYRRSWAVTAFDPAALHVPAKVRFRESMAKQFQDHHGYDGREMCVSCCGSETPLTAGEMAASWDQGTIHPHLMAVGPRESYVSLWKLVEAQLWPIWDKHAGLFMAMNRYNRRGPAFIAERILTAILMRKERFLPGIKVKATGITFHHPSSVPERRQKP